MKFIPAYLPAVGYLAALRNSDTLECCLHSHYEKQTYRNRCTIYGANGRLNLTVPVMHNSNGQRQTDLEMKIHYADNWQKNHWKSLEAAYRSSPYFEFYEDELSEVYQQNHQGLMEMNLAFIVLFYRWLDEPFSMTMVEEYSPLSKEEEKLLDAKSTPKEYPNYPQTFDNKHGFISSLSCVDLFFNLGPEAKQYLNHLT